MKKLILLFTLISPITGLSAGENPERQYSSYTADLSSIEINDSSYPDIVIGNKKDSEGLSENFDGNVYPHYTVEQSSNVSVMGLHRKTALSMSGTFLEGQLDNDDPCSSRHNAGDVSNRWCHAYFSELSYSLLKDNGYNEYISHAGGILVFLVKELADKNYDWSDVSTAPIGGNINETTASYVTFMMDGSFQLYLTKNF